MAERFCRFAKLDHHVQRLWNQRDSPRNVVTISRSRDPSLGSGKSGCPTISRSPSARAFTRACFLSHVEARSWKRACERGSTARFSGSLVKAKRAGGLRGDQVMTLYSMKKTHKSPRMRYARTSGAVMNKRLSCCSLST